MGSARHPLTSRVRSHELVLTQFSLRTLASCEPVHLPAQASLVAIVMPSARHYVAVRVTMPWSIQGHQQNCVYCLAGQRTDLVRATVLA
jgi:hypothetical protein